MLVSQREFEKKVNRKFKIHKEHNFKRIFVNVALVATLLGVGSYVGNSFVSPYFETSQINDEIVATALAAVDQEMDFSDYEQVSSNTMLEGAQEINPDICGFITADFIDSDSNILPVLQGSTDDEYLGKAADGSSNSKGSLAMVTVNDSENIMNNQVTIIQGHNLLSGQMFGDLDKYKDQSYLDSNPTFTYSDAYGEYVIHIVAAGNENASGYDVEYANDEDFLNAMNNFVNSAITTSGEEITAEDHIFRLSTCKGDGDYSERFQIIGTVEKVKDYMPSMTSTVEYNHGTMSM